MMPPKDAMAAAFAWWAELRPDPARNQPGDRAALARLRRCATVADAMQEPAAVLLFRRLRSTGPGDLPHAALAAAVLAHVRADVPGASVARLVGPGSIETPETRPAEAAAVPPPGWKAWTGTSAWPGSAAWPPWLVVPCRCRTWPGRCCPGPMRGASAG